MPNPLFHEQISFIAKNLSFRLGCAFLALAALSGCEGIKGTAAQDSGFLTGTALMKEQRDRYPFHKAWVKEPGYIQKNYSKVYFAPVNIDYVTRMNWYRQATPEVKEFLSKELAGVSPVIRKHFEDAVRSYSGPFDYPEKQVVIRPDADTAIIELALVELVPTKEGWATLATLMKVVVPGGFLVTAATDASGSIAMEARVRDGKTGEVVGRFADREVDQKSFINLRGMKWYGNAEAHVKQWAKQTAQLLHTKPGTKVEDDLAIAPVSL